MITKKNTDYHIQKCGGPYAFVPFLPMPLEKLHEFYQKDNTLENIAPAIWLTKLGYNFYQFTKHLSGTYLSENEALLLIKTAAQQLCLFTSPIILPTKHGAIQARFIQDPEIPGIALLYKESDNGDPGVIMSYQKNTDEITLRLYPKEETDTAPQYVFHVN